MSCQVFCWRNDSRFKSVIVEGGVAARTMTAYIDLNPVRAGMVENLADYRWGSYWEAVGEGSVVEHEGSAGRDLKRRRQ